MSTELTANHGQYDISAGGEITIDVGYLTVNAGFNSSHGFYIADSNGNPIGGVVMQDNVKDLDAQSITVNTDDYPGGVTLGFFIIPDGDRKNADLSDGDTVTFQQINGVWTPIYDGTALSGQSAPAYFSDPSLNPDGFDHFSDSASPGNQNWEDLFGGGDQDFTDVNTDVTVTIVSNTMPVIQANIGVAVDLPDIISALTDTDGSESLTLSISQIANGAVLSDGVNSYTALSDNATVDVTGWNLDNIQVTPAKGSPDFNLQVTATSTEASNGDVATTTQSISIEIADQIIQGTVGAENLQGAGGDDTLIYNADSAWTGFSAHNTVTGENVSLSGFNRSSDVFDGGDGYDILQGTSGNDALFLDDSISSFEGDSQARIQNVEEINLGAGDDILDMTSSSLTYDQGIIVDGGTGNDIIWTSTGDDTLIGGAGSDSLFGGAGNDTLTGGVGADLISGGAGDDTLYTNADFIWTGSSAWNNITGDTQALVGMNGSSDVFIGGDGNDTLIATDGADIIFQANTSGDFYNDAPQARIQSIENVDLGAGDDILDMVHTSIITTDDMTVQAGDGNDTVWMDQGNDTVYGDAGNDDIFGGAGNDTLYGGTGADTIDGYTGDDTLIGGAGNDTLIGGDGDDTFIFGSNDGSDTVQGGAGGGWTDVIQLDAFTGSDSQQGWTLTLDDGSSITSTDESLNEILLSDDAAGTIIFDDGTNIDFDGIEKIVW